MNFLIKNKKLVNVFFVISEIIDIFINFMINILSKDEFNIFDAHNIMTFAVFLALLIFHIICQLLIRNNTAKGQKRHLQKVFKEKGGYDSVVKEMITCIENHDFKSIRELKKAVKYIER